MKKENRKKLKELIFESKEWEDLDRGTVDNEEAIKNFIQKKPELEEEIKKVMNNWKFSLKPINKYIELAKELKNKEYDLFLLSNFHKEAYEYAKVKFNFISDFDGEVISCYVNSVKPEKEIYKYLIENYNLKPEKTLFLDDSEKNVEGARKIGIKSIIVDSESIRKVKKELNK